MRLKYSFETIEINEDIMAVPVGSGAENKKVVIRLNKTGEDIFRLLDHDVTEDEIQSVLQNEYETSGQDLKAQISNYITKLRRAGLIIE